MNKTIILIALTVTLSIKANAQRLKYKDVFNIVTTASPEEAYMSLLEYQKQDPEFPNTYFQLGMISKKWAFEYDPFTNYDDVSLYIYNTKLFLGLAKAKLSKKENDVRKNRKYYLNYEILPNVKKIKYEDLIAFLDKQILEIKDYEENLNKIMSNFSSCVENYNNCISIFMEINKEYSKIKNIYLASTEKIQQQVKNLKASYDSTLYYFDKYKTAIKNYPIEGYNQELEIRPIITYRLEGLTSSNFLKNKILIWNYGEWVDNLTKIWTDDIYSLQNDIILTNRKMNKTYSTLLKSDKYSDNFTPFYLDDKLIFRIEKYDYNSLITSLFNFRSSELNFLISFKKKINDPVNPDKAITLVKRARYYDDLLKIKLKTDSLNNILKGHILPEKVEKFKNFIEVNYSGIDGLRKYAQDERLLVEKKMNQSFNNLKKMVIFYNNIFKNDTTAYVLYKDKKVPLYKVTPEYQAAEKDKYYTTDIRQDKYGNYYISGFFKTTDQSSQAFVAKTNKTNAIAWLKTTNISNNTFDCALNVIPTEDGCIAVINSKFNDQLQNMIVRFDADGKQKAKLKLPTQKVPRFISYDDINENVLVAYKGNELNPFASKADPLIIEKINITTKESWNTTLNITGNLFDIVKMDTTYLVFANYTKYVSTTGPTVISAAGTDNNSTNILITILSGATGNVLSTKTIEDKKPFFGIRALKLNSEKINIVGINAPLYDINNTDVHTGTLFYALLDKFGNIKYLNNKK